MKFSKSLMMLALLASTQAVVLAKFPSVNSSKDSGPSTPRPYGPNPTPKPNPTLKEEAPRPNPTPKSSPQELNKNILMISLNGVKSYFEKPEQQHTLVDISNAEMSLKQLTNLIEGQIDKDKQRLEEEKTRLASPAFKFKSYMDGLEVNENMDGLEVNENYWNENSYVPADLWFNLVAKVMPNGSENEVIKKAVMVANRRAIDKDVQLGGAYLKEIEEGIKSKLNIAIENQKGNVIEQGDEPQQGDEGNQDAVEVSTAIVDSINQLSNFLLTNGTLKTKQPYFESLGNWDKDVFTMITEMKDRFEALDSAKKNDVKSILLKALARNVQEFMQTHTGLSQVQGQSLTQAKDRLAQALNENLK